MIGGTLLARIHRDARVADPAQDTLRMWDELRAGAISQADREEIDAVFSRQTP